MVRRPDIPLPRGWPKHVKSAILHAVSLARVALVAARGRAVRAKAIQARLQAELEEARAEIALLQEELRLKDLRMNRVSPRRRPHYRPTERMAILELRAARGWSKAQAAERLLLRPATVAEWMKRVDESGARALLQTSEPVNRLPDFIRYFIRRLKVVCPTMGKKRIAQTLARAGLHLGVTTVGRILKEDDTKGPKTASGTTNSRRRFKPVQAKHPNHTWQLDLTVVPTAAGFWVPWLPFSVPQAWPFSWWLACVVDHYSRRVLGFRVFPKEPTSLEIRTFLGVVIGRRKATPKYIVTDKGPQFDCGSYRAWCGRKGISPRYASTGNLRATAVVERFFRSLKEEWLRQIPVPLRREAMNQEVACYLTWFEEHRPHQGIGGRTPNEAYGAVADNDPATKPAASPTARRELAVRFHEGRKQLPIIELKTAA